MGGKGGQSGPSREQMQAQAYDAGAAGIKWSGPGGVHERSGGGGQDLLDAWMQGQQSMGGGGSHAGKPYDFFADAMKGMHSPQADTSSSDAYAEAIAQQTADLAQQEAERRRIEGQNRRDALYSDYLDAAGSATDYINSMINQELANAQLLGIDYEIDDDTKQTRINDYFGSLGGEGQQGELEALMKEWGNPKGFGGFTVVRGSGETLQASEGGEETVAISKGIKPTIVSEEEDQLLGGGPSVLGV